MLNPESPPQPPTDDEIFSQYDPKTRECRYTVARHGLRWTIAVPMADFDQFGPLSDETSKQRRRGHLSNLLISAMQGEPDGEHR